MTIDEINAMPAGVKMDAAVAEVLGWENITPESTQKYSTEIAAAWELLKQVDDARFWLRQLLSKSWSCRFDFLDDIIVADGNTAPLAICRAFLLCKLANN